MKKRKSYYSPEMEGIRIDSDISLTLGSFNTLPGDPGPDDYSSWD